MREAWNSRWTSGDIIAMWFGFTLVGAITGIVLANPI